METMALKIHIASVVVLALIIALDLAVIHLQKSDRKLRKYLRIQATVWSTVLSMVIFTGLLIAAVMHMWFSVKVVVMAIASVALITLEIRRHYDLKRAKSDTDCFATFRKRAVRYYIFELLWILMVGGLAPQLP